MKGLYIHIPFCKSICSYCDFPKMMAKQQVYETYISHLLKELEVYKQDLYDIRSVYIGGGTPNVLPDSLLQRLLEALEPYLRDSKENTIEINPELLTEKQVALMARYHINRVSIGVQTFNKIVLKAILRHHSYMDVRKAVELLDRYKIKNINLDMMVGLPFQTMQTLEKDFYFLDTLPIQHISYYSLILEEKTILSHQLKQHRIGLPDDDYVADMLIKVDQYLKKKQFIHYEISNYALRGYSSIHNLGYWNAEEYIGIGAGASGYLHNRRYTNHILLNSYYQTYIETSEIISIEEQKREFMMLGLRKLEGISLEVYQNKFHTTPFDDFNLKSLLEQGFIEIINQNLRIKEDKILLGNLVFQEFVR